VLAARVFEREHVLLGGREPLRTLLGLSRRQGGEPTAAFSLTAYGAIQVVFFYGSLLLARFGTLPQVVATQYGFFLLPTLGCVLAFGFSARQTLALRLPSPRALAGSILIGVSAGAVILGVIGRLISVPEPVAKKLGDLLLLDGQPLAVLLLLLALTPALCEELLFRGMLLSGLRRLGPLPALVLSALFFGLAHGSIYRLAPTTLLGLALGHARLRSGSIASGMVIHALNNGLALTLLYYRPGWAESLLEGATLPWSLTLAALVVFGAGIWLVRDRPGAPG
jgi:sodium transport system permease protein